MHCFSRPRQSADGKKGGRKTRRPRSPLTDTDVDRRVELLRILAFQDPLGICLASNPRAIAEYAPEARTILPRLSRGLTSSDVRQVLVEEFDHWFWPGSLEKSGKLDAIVSEVLARLIERS